MEEDKLIQNFDLNKLAYLGDAFFELYTRNKLYDKYKDTIDMNEMHKINTSIVCAKNQSSFIDKLDKSIEDIKNANLNENEKEYLNKLIEYKDLYISKLNDDFNTSDAITQIFEIVRLANLNKDSINNISLLSLTNNLLITFLNVMGIIIKSNN